MGGPGRNARSGSPGTGVMRGGAWNNNPNTVRAANRNRNDPTNRNDNNGFRVVVASAHVYMPLLLAASNDGCGGGVRTRARPFRQCSPATAVEPRRRERNSAGRVWSARRPAWARRYRALPAPGAYKRRGIAWLQNPLCPPFGLLEPAAQQLSNFGDHAADMLVLTAAQPMPFEGEAQIEARLIELCIGRLQTGQPRRSIARVGIKQALLKIERGILQAASHHETLVLREIVAVRQQPHQQVARLSKNHHVIHI